MQWNEHRLAPWAALASWNSVLVQVERILGEMDEYHHIRKVVGIIAHTLCEYVSYVARAQLNALQSVYCDCFSGQRKHHTVARRRTQSIATVSVTNASTTGSSDDEIRPS